MRVNGQVINIVLKGCFGLIMGTKYFDTKLLYWYTHTHKHSKTQNNFIYLITILRIDPYHLNSNEIIPCLEKLPKNVCAG
jgi:hypothetical protein